MLVTQVSQKRAARSAEQAKHNLHRQSDCQQPVTSVQQQQRQLPSRSITGPADEHESEHHQPWQAQKTQPAQHELQQKQSSSSLHEDASMGMAGVERGVRPRGGAAMTMTSELSDTNARAPPAPQVGSSEYLQHKPSACSLLHLPHSKIAPCRVFGNPHSILLHTAKLSSCIANVLQTRLGMLAIPWGPCIDQAEKSSGPLC